MVCSSASDKGFLKATGAPVGIIVELVERVLRISLGSEEKFSGLEVGKYFT